MITLDRVGKSYPGGVTALRDVSLTIEPGEMVGVVGPSGSGKSTMLHMMGALDLPTTGSVTIGGRDVSRLSDRQLSALRERTIGFVFQQFHLAAGVPAVDNGRMACCTRASGCVSGAAGPRKPCTAWGLATA